MRARDAPFGRGMPGVWLIVPAPNGPLSADMHLLEPRSKASRLTRYRHLCTTYGPANSAVLATERRRHQRWLRLAAPVDESAFSDRGVQLDRVGNLVVSGAGVVARRKRRCAKCDHNVLDTLFDLGRPHVTGHATAALDSCDEHTNLRGGPIRCFLCVETPCCDRVLPLRRGRRLMLRRGRCPRVTCAVARTDREADSDACRQRFTPHCSSTVFSRFRFLPSAGNQPTVPDQGSADRILYVVLSAPPLRRRRTLARWSSSKRWYSRARARSTSGSALTVLLSDRARPLRTTSRAQCWNRLWYPRFVIHHARDGGLRSGRANRSR